MTHQKTTTVAILSGNPLVNRAIESLLEGLGYGVRLLEDYEAGQKEMFEGVDLVLLAPTVSDGFRQTFLTSLRNDPQTASIPALTLTTALEETIADKSGFVPWPCRLEDLAGHIKNTLQALVADELPVEASDASSGVSSGAPAL